MPSKKTAKLVPSCENSSQAVDMMMADHLKVHNALYPDAAPTPAVPADELDALLIALAAHLKATAKDYATPHRTALGKAFDAYMTAANVRAKKRMAGK